MNNHSKVISKVIHYIEQYLEDELALEQIASEVGYSKYHLNRIFAENVGCTIHQYIQKRRLTEAARELVYTDKPIIDIALSSGYETQQSFTLAFKRMYHISPQAYRRRKEFSPIQIKAVRTRLGSTSCIRMSRAYGRRVA